MAFDRFEDLKAICEKADLNKEQLKELILILQRRYLESRPVGIHVSKEVSDDIDFDIMCLGRSQKKVCETYGISRTTYKRHRKKLIEQGHKIPNYKSREQIIQERIIEAEKELERLREEPLLGYYPDEVYIQRIKDYYHIPYKFAENIFNKNKRMIMEEHRKNNPHLFDEGNEEEVKPKAKKVKGSYKSSSNLEGKLRKKDHKSIDNTDNGNDDDFNNFDGFDYLNEIPIYTPW